jgi:hypothetical protein
MAERLIAKTDAGDRLFQVGTVIVDEELGGLNLPTPRDLSIKPSVRAYGFVEFADGRRVAVENIESFLSRGFFEQVAEVDETVTG